LLLAANQAWNIVNFRLGLIGALRRDGYRIVVCAPPDEQNSAHLERNGCEFIPLEIDSKGLSLFNDIRTFFAFLKIMRKIRPTAFLGWTIKPNIYGGLAARIASVPAVLNISGLGTAFIRDSAITQLVTILYRIGLAKAHTVFFQNKPDRDLFVARRMVREDQVALLPGSGIDLDRFTPAPVAARETGHFVMIARVLGDKGVREYVEAARLLKDRGFDLRLSLMGFVDVANRTAIDRTELDSWVSEGLIEYHPPVEDVRPMIAKAHAVVLPSYREGTSRVLLEAAAMGRPIIAADVPGCREIVDDGVTGFLCAPRDGRALADAIQRCVELPPQRWSDMATAGRAKVAREFSEERVFAIYRNVLNGITARK